MLRDAKITESRPEILAVLDFKPLYAVGGDLTIAGKMFDARVGERTQTLETIKTLLTDLELNLPDEYSAALNQYASSLAATEADLALLKLMILLREYATHTARFLDFVDEYEAPEGLDMTVWGDDTAEQIFSILGMRKARETSDHNFWSYASKPLIQIMSDISFCTYGLVPGLMIKTSRKSDGIAKKFSSHTRDELPLLCLNYSLRDMVASYEFVKLREGDEIDDTFSALVADVLGASFVTSGNKQSWTAFKELAGSDSWARMRASTDTEYVGLKSPATQTSLAGMLNAKSGVLDKMQIKYDGDKILIPETADQSLDGREYRTIDPIIEAAFSGDPPLDFTNFNTIIEDFTKSLTDLEAFGKTLCRMGEKSTEAGLSPQPFALVGDDPPFNLASGGAAVLDVWKRRFLDVFYDSSYSTFDEWQSAEHVMYNRMIAWIMIREDPDMCYGFVSAFISDYEDGFLTAAGIPEETDVLDSDGEPTGNTEWAATQYVLPGTTTPANVTTITPRLLNKMYNIREWFDKLGHLTTTVTVDDDYLLAPGHSAENQPWRKMYQFAIGTTTDYRPINFMHRRICGEYVNTTQGSGDFKTAYMSIKIVAAEIIDAVLEILRMFMAPIEEVEPVEDGDPIWPSLVAVKSPYSNEIGGVWTYNLDMYAEFATSSWCPTVELWHKLFARSIAKKTYFRNGTIRDHAKNIVRCMSALMQPLEAIKLRHNRKEWSHGGNDFEFDIVSFAVPTDSRFQAEYYQQFFKNLGLVVENILDSSWSKMEDLEVPDVDWEEVRQRQPTGTAINDISGIVGRNGFEAFHEETKEFMLRARKNDVGLEFLYDFIGGYAERITNYNAAVQGIVSGEDSSLATFVSSVLDAGDSGTDILQNITPIQMALKQIALEEEIGDEKNAYLPTAAIINEREVIAVQTLCRETKAISPEGDNSKIVVVGLPAGMFEKLEIKDERFKPANFAIRISYIDIEYPQLVFHGKTYPFYRDLYLKPDGLESGGISYGSFSFKDLVESAKFTKLSVEIEESNDTTASITINDEETTKTIKAAQNPFISYSNLTASEAIKIYCRIMLGMNFSESAFLGTSDGIQIPINDYAADLAGSMAEGLNTLGEFSENLASGATDVLSDLSKLDEDVFVSGEIEAVDESLLTSLRDAFQTRLFSSEVMRSRVLSAKMFDRIFALIIDPDEFYIVAPDDIDASSATTPQNILDFYLQKGIIEETGQDAPFRYKLAPRTTGEGKMSFGKFFVSIVSKPTNEDRILE